MVLARIKPVFPVFNNVDRELQKRHAKADLLGVRSTTEKGVSK
jgi:hypothetical protein